MASGNSRCKVIGCRTANSKDNTKENGITFFIVPSASLSKWQELTPLSNLTTKSRICSRHFDESDILKGVKMSDGFHPYKNWRLRPGALPKHLLCPSELFVIICKSS
jgi:hypothetical protein